MEPLQVIPTDQPAQVNPWPGVVRLVALMALMFAAAQIFHDTPIFVSNFSRPSIYRTSSTTRALVSRRWQAIHHLRVAVATIDVLDCAVMAAGALLLLRFPQFRMPIVVAAWAWLAIWGMSEAVSFLSLGWMGVQSLGRSLMWIGFPVLTILLLSEYGKTATADPA